MVSNDYDMVIKEVIEYMCNVRIICMYTVKESLYQRKLLVIMKRNSIKLFKSETHHLKRTYIVT